MSYMIPIQLGTKKYGLTFEHRHIPLDVMNETPRLADKMTIAKVYDLGVVDTTANPFPVAEGKAECSVKDLFLKETGRKVALTRLLRAWGLSKELRTLVWDAYRNRGGKTVRVSLTV